MPSEGNGLLSPIRNKLLTISPIQLNIVSNFIASLFIQVDYEKLIIETDLGGEKLCALRRS